MIAKSVDLTAVASNLGYTVRRVGKYYTLKEMDSIRIYDKSHWFRWSRQYERGNNGGSQIDFLRVFCDMDVKTAVFWLLDFAGYRGRLAEEKKPQLKYQVKNNDCVLDGLMVRTEESNIAPTIYLNPYFEQIQDGAELDDVLAQIASVYQSHYIDHDIDVSAVTDFDKIKEKIVCKLINEEANQQFLQDKPYSKLEDLAVVYQILMDKTGEGTATITITDNLMDGYGITLEELHDQALQNMDTLQPHSFKGMNETVAEMIAVDIARDQNIGMDEAKEMAMQMMPDIPDTMFVLTNDTKVNGAAAILNDDIRQEIAEKVGDFYMLPSSIHETLIIPKDAGMEFKELEQMVQEVNQTQVAPGERLSDHVYEYDAKEHELFRSDRAEERAKQKEEKRDNRHERVSVKEKLAEKKDAVIKMNAGKEHSAPEKKKEAVI
uniref:DUF5688 family protein n=1 Tax=Variimorphobacter saccharofermentans TaxID=2755051 RepID=UPI002B1E194E|nr:DUF5688 family protein [Variimorphobacter saccharofermentans]